MEGALIVIFEKIFSDDFFLFLFQAGVSETFSLSLGPFESHRVLE